MALFERENTDFSADVATRALSRRCRNDFVEGVTKNRGLRPTFGPAPSQRLIAIDRMGIKPGDKFSRWRRHRHQCVSYFETVMSPHDFSGKMLRKARERVVKKGVKNVRLHEMDAGNLAFADDAFDIVYAPYVISVVSDPLRVVSEMRRVCRPGGKIVILNHFRSLSPFVSRVERASRLRCVWPRPTFDFSASWRTLSHAHL
jgi:phosphatidylethanolamine/phosphatidyl-N-methylethanolamine N-methyltransferase